MYFSAIILLCWQVVLDYGPWDQIRVDQGKEWYLRLFVQEFIVPALKGLLSWNCFQLRFANAFLCTSGKSQVWCCKSMYMLELSFLENKLNQLAVIIQLMFCMDAYFMPMCDGLFQILLKSNNLQLVDIRSRNDNSRPNLVAQKENSIKL